MQISAVNIRGHIPECVARQQQSMNMRGMASITINCILCGHYLSLGDESDVMSITVSQLLRKWPVFRCTWIPFYLLLPEIASQLSPSSTFTQEDYPLHEKSHSPACTQQ